MALEAFHFQFKNNPVYREFVRSLNIIPVEVESLEEIPFMPVSFYKSRSIKTTDFTEVSIFESSGTTGSINSRHYIRSHELYNESFTRTFELFYGPAKEWCILGLLPSYLERKNSSLVYMINSLIMQSEHPLSGFYLYDHERLYHTLQHNEIRKQPTLLIGVTFALMDFAETYQMKLSHTTIMETGGMKGQGPEITRAEVHSLLSARLGVKKIHSEYGMTELLSQAYSKGDGFFKSPPWMRILLRDEDDPLLVRSNAVLNSKPLDGLINVIDLANIYSCCFIATDDVGRLHHNGSFEVLGRCDNSDVRGCSLMVE